MRVLRYPDLKAEKGVPFCKVHLARLEAAGQFPRRVRLGSGTGGTVAWIESEIDGWLEERAAARDAETEAA